MLIDKIKVDQLQARKMRVQLAIKALTPIISAIETLAKERKTTDADVVNVLKQHIKGLNILQKAYVKDNRDTGSIIAEIGILNMYLPKQKTEEELLLIIEGYWPFNNIGPVMGRLKKEYPQQYDSKVAASIIRRLL